MEARGATKVEVIVMQIEREKLEFAVAQEQLHDTYVKHRSKLETMAVERLKDLYAELEMAQRSMAEEAEEAGDEVEDDDDRQHHDRHIDQRAERLSDRDHRQH